MLEELGTYDPMVPYEDARAVMDGERVKYWLGVGALPTEKVKILIKKYGPQGTRLDQQKAALDRWRRTAAGRCRQRSRRRPRRPRRTRRRPGRVGGRPLRAGRRAAYKGGSNNNSPLPLGEGQGVRGRREENRR